MTQLAPPHALPVFNFRVDFFQVDASGKPTQTQVPLCSGRFSEVSGLEATMEPKTIREGGRNFGELQRVGIVKFSTAILKRGLTRAPDLWTWLEMVGRGKSGIRLLAKVVQLGPDAETPVMTWTLSNALPVKFKAATYVAASSEIGVEELHFVYDDMALALGDGT